MFWARNLLVLFASLVVFTSAVWAGPPGDDEDEDADHSDEAGVMQACATAQFADRAGLSRAEVAMLTSLGDRREALDAREAELAVRENYAEAAEARLEERVEEIKALRSDVEGLLGMLDDAEQARVDGLITLYQSMKPKDAARIMPGLEPDVRLAVAAGMQERALANVLALMPQGDAVELTMLLARQHDITDEVEQQLVNARQGD